MTGIGTDEANAAATDEGQTGLDDVGGGDGGGDGPHATGDAPDDEDDETPTTTVRERIRSELDADELHGLTATHRTETAVYLLVARSTTWETVDEDAVVDDLPVLDYRTVVFDVDAQDIRVSDNGLWTPQDEDVAQNMARLASRASSDVSGAVDEDAEALSMSATDEVDVDELLDHEVEVPDEDRERTNRDVEKMRRHHGISPSRPWGYGGGPPPEVEDVVDRLEGVGLDASDHLFRLEFGKKEPFDVVDKSADPPNRGHDVDELRGNYGVDCLSQDAGLVVVDVDYPDEFPDEVDLPRTFSISSPHGDDRRRHLLFYCEDKQALVDDVGAWSTQAPEWGDLWAGANRYVVGAGSQLSAYGCDTGDNDRDSPECCARCDDEDRGFYRIVNDVPIAEVEASTLAELVPDDDPDEAGHPAATDDDVEDDEVACMSCGRTVDEDDVEDMMKEIGGGRHICRTGTGGCT
jgi:hypothetical protein